MDNGKLSGLMYIAAGALFVFSSFIGGNLFTLPVGAVLILLGCRKMKGNREDDSQEEAW